MDYEVVANVSSHPPSGDGSLSAAGDRPPAPATSASRRSWIGGSSDHPCLLVVAVRLGVVVGPVTSYLLVAGSGEFWWVERMGWIDLSLNRSSSSHCVPEQRESRVLIRGDGWVVIGRLLPGVVRRVVGVRWGDDWSPDASRQVTCPVRYRV